MKNNDYLGREVNVNDVVLRAASYGRSQHLELAIITKIEEEQKRNLGYNSGEVWVISEGNKKPGRTYLDRILLINENDIPTKRLIALRQAHEQYEDQKK